MEACIQNGKRQIQLPFKVIYTLYGNGVIDFHTEFIADEQIELPRLGLTFLINPLFEEVQYYGRGPHENYSDRKNAAFIGRYKTTVSAMEESYVRPQTMGNREDIRWLTLSSPCGKGIKITSPDQLSFSALHYTDTDLWSIRYKHDLPTIRRAEIVLNLDCIQKGLGNASCGPPTRPEYDIQPGHRYSYSFRLQEVTRQ